MLLLSVGPRLGEGEGGWEAHLQRLDVLKLVGVPLFDLLVLPSGEEKVSFGDKLEEHDTAERARESEQVRSEPGREAPGHRRPPRYLSS